MHISDLGSLPTSQILSLALFCEDLLAVGFKLSASDLGRCQAFISSSCSVCPTGNRACLEPFPYRSLQYMCIIKLNESLKRTFALRLYFLCFPVRNRNEEKDLLSLFASVSRCNLRRVLTPQNSSSFRVGFPT